MGVPCSGGSTGECSTSAKSTVSSTSRCGRTGRLHWDVLRLWLEIKQGMERASGLPIESVGVDAWGCDYALVGEQGVLLQNPYHYRDKRTDGVMETVFKRVPADEIYGITGIQFLPFNTLYQLYAACRATPRLIDAATGFGTDSRSRELLADRGDDRRVHERYDDTVHRRADAIMGDRHAAGTGRADAHPPAGGGAGHGRREDAAGTRRRRFAARASLRPHATTPGRLWQPSRPVRIARS